MGNYYIANFAGTRWADSRGTGLNDKSMYHEHILKVRVHDKGKLQKAIVINPGEKVEYKVLEKEDPTDRGVTKIEVRSNCEMGKSTQFIGIVTEYPTVDTILFIVEKQDKLEFEIVYQL